MILSAITRSTNPISPTCAYDSVDCDTPMRLEGIPLGGVSLARDSKKVE